MSDRQLQELAGQVETVRATLDEIARNDPRSDEDMDVRIAAAGIALIGIVGGIARDLNRLAEALERIAAALENQATGDSA